MRKGVKRYILDNIVYNTLIYCAPLAQPVERTAVNRKVTGSKPVWSE